MKKEKGIGHQRGARGRGRRSGGGMGNAYTDISLWVYCVIKKWWVRGRKRKKKKHSRSRKRGGGGESPLSFLMSAHPVSTTQRREGGKRGKKPFRMILSLPPDQQFLWLHTWLLWENRISLSLPWPVSSFRGTKPASRTIRPPFHFHLLSPTAHVFRQVCQVEGY